MSKLLVGDHRFKKRCTIPKYIVIYRDGFGFGMREWIEVMGWDGEEREEVPMPTGCLSEKLFLWLGWGHL